MWTILWVINLSFIGFYDVFEMMDEVLGIFHSHAQRRLQTKHISPSTTPPQKHPPLPQLLQNLITNLLRRLLSVPILNHLNTNHQPSTPSIPNNPTSLGNSLQFLEQVPTDNFGVDVKFFTVDGFDDFDCGTALDVASSGCVEEEEVHAVCDLFAGGYCG